MPFYIAVFSLFLLLLSAQVIRCRRRAKIAVGHGDDVLLQRAIRAQANFTEYVPLSLLLLLCLEIQLGLAMSAVAIHCLAFVLLLSRILHAWGIRQVNEPLRFRFIGMVGTFSVILVSAVWLLVRYFMMA
ncbi:MAPEG family protein [Vibrio stylophorae]|nr:MAPEG family protein [Vibrio stylophorae]